MLKMKLPGRRKKGRPQRFIDVVKGDMQRAAEVTPEGRSQKIIFP